MRPRTSVAGHPIHAIQNPFPVSDLIEDLQSL